MKNFCGILLFCAFALSALTQPRPVSTVARISVLNQYPLQIQIQASRPLSPKVEMVSGPDRLVIDISNSLPGASLRNMVLNRADVRAVRFSRYSERPPVTRVVLDLNSPEWYRVIPNAAGLLVTLGSDAANAGNAQPAIGWVSTKTTTAHTAPVVLRKAASSRPASVNGVRVQFANGLLTIHAENATLSEILFQIQKITGAEIAIPSGTEQERVAADFGPGTASEVMGELLNGSGLNFVVVGSPTNPNQLRSVILSRNTGGPDPPSAFAIVSQPQASAPVEPENPESSGPPADNGMPPPQPIVQPPDQIPN